MIPLPREEWHLPARHVGRRALVFDRLDSTNNLVVALAGCAATEGVAVLANEQSAGRGQHGRSWTAPPKSSVLLSVLLFPPLALRRPALLTAWAAVSVCEAVREATGLQARIKWPNDVLVRGRKVCGILLEQPGVNNATVAGIGLNVTQTADDFARAGLPAAGSLAMFSERVPDMHAMARRLLAHLDEEYDRLLQGDTSTLEACWKWRIGLLGRFVLAECGDGPRRGRLLDLGFDGLHLELAGGEVICLQPERVLHLHQEGEW